MTFSNLLFSYPKLESLSLEWFGLPAVSSMQFEVGGIPFPCAPFSGWYSLNEIATRDLLDEQRYNLRQVKLPLAPMCYSHTQECKNVLIDQSSELFKLSCWLWHSSAYTVESSGEKLLKRENPFVFWAIFVHELHPQCVSSFQVSVRNKLKSKLTVDVANDSACCNGGYPPINTWQ